jgi:hypothetical protein
MPSYYCLILAASLHGFLFYYVPPKRRWTTTYLHGRCTLPSRRCEIIGFDGEHFEGG